MKDKIIEILSEHKEYIEQLKVRVDGKLKQKYNFIFGFRDIDYYGESLVMGLVLGDRVSSSVNSLSDFSEGKLEKLLPVLLEEMEKNINNNLLDKAYEESLREDNSEILKKLKGNLK